MPAPGEAPARGRGAREGEGAVSVWPRLAGLLAPRAPLLAAGAAATALHAVLDAAVYVLLIPFVDALFGAGGRSGAGDNPMGRLLDATVYRWVPLEGDPVRAVTGVVAVLLAVFAAKNLLFFARAYLAARAEQAVSRDLRNRLYEHLVELDLAFFGRVRMGQLVSRLTTEVETLRAVLTSEALRFLSALLELVAALAAMLLISWKLTLASLVVVPGAMAMWGPLVKALRRRDRRLLDVGAEVAGHVQETLTGIRLVKASAAEGRERERFRRLTDEHFRLFLRAEALRSLAVPLTEMLAAVGTAVLLLLGARLVAAGELSGAQFVGFLGLSLKLYAPVKNLAKFPATAQPGIAAAERIFEVLDAPREVRERPGALPFRGPEREISFEGVGFAHGPGGPVLRDVTFTVPRGSMVALVGPSGAGKTTLVDLLGRFHDPTAGRVTVDGVDVRDLRLADLRERLGVVSQDTVLFHDTVAANIAYTRPDATREEIEAAARAAHAHEFIVRLPHGYDTVVGERGAFLSGGERQRLAIARAILRDPPILVFDEATSALDAGSERLVQDALDRLLEGRTVFVVAHRLATARRAPRILVLDGGRIVEDGDHASLLARGGLYSRLHALQHPTDGDGVAGGA